MPETPDKPFDPARPRHTLPLAGKEYELLGTLELVEAVENAMKNGIVQICTRAPGMGLADTAKLLSAVLTASGHKMTPREAGQVLFNEVGINTEAFQMTQLHLYAFLRVILEPPEAREEVASDMGEMLGEWNARPASPGEPTRNSA